MQIVLGDADAWEIWLYILMYISTGILKKNTKTWNINRRCVLGTSILKILDMKAEVIINNYCSFYNVEKDQQRGALVSIS